MPSKKTTPASNPSPTSTNPKEKTTNLCSDSPSDSEPIECIDVLELISKAKFPVYLAFSPSLNKNLALKLYNFEDGKPHRYFLNERRFITLDHPNIIKIIHTEEETPVNSSTNDSKQVSCILMEYAPYGDLFDFLKKVRYNFTEKLARTYFHQLIEGIEHLHQKNVYHLDLKLENLLIGEDYQLKIADFDLSYMEGDADILTKGTKYYRAPELKEGRDDIDESADIFAAGTILFVMKCGGALPHAENKLYNGIDLFDLMMNNHKEFFRVHCEIQGVDNSFFSESFRDFFRGMVKMEPEQRMSIADIKKSRWYNRSIYTPSELKKKMKKLLNRSM